MTETLTTETTQAQYVKNYFANLPKAEALKLAVEDLFSCLGRKSSKRSSEVFVRLLLDLDTDLLAEGLSRAMVTAKDWMTPAAIRELCLGGSQADLDAAAADEAWAWVLKFVTNHGAEGRVKPGALIFHSDKAPTCAPDIQAPDTPPLIQNALQSLAGTIYDARYRIAQATSTELVFIKREFVSTYGRARRMA